MGYSSLLKNHRMLLHFCVISMCFGLIPGTAHAWAIIDNLTKIFGSSGCGDHRCYTPTAVAGIRGSNADIIHNPDGSETWIIIEGDFEFTVRATGEQFTLHAGDAYTFPRPESWLFPSEYIRSHANVGADNFSFQASFQKVFEGNLFNAQAHLQSMDANHSVINGDLMLGDILTEEIVGSSQAITITNWNDLIESDFLSWTFEYDDAYGVHHTSGSLPFLADALTSVTTVDEPSPAWLVAICLIAISCVRQFKLRQNARFGRHEASIAAL